MYKIINEYFKENSDQIKKKFKDASVNDLKIGAMVNHELMKFIENTN